MRGGKKRNKVALFGHFGCSNFGNESTLQAMLYHIRRFRPDAEITCICTNPKAAAAIHHIEAIPIEAIPFAGTPFHPWIPQNALARPVRKLGRILGEPYCWVKGLMKLRRTDMFIVSGTGLLTDAYGLFGWGPYNVLKWSLIAKACRCKLLFVSVGVGPLYSAIGRFCVKLALSLADVRSYRDISTKLYLERVGFRADNDPVYPDLAFSLPVALLPDHDAQKSSRPVVGLGLMEYAGRYSVPRPSDETYLAYVANLVTAAGWLVANGYDIRLLVGDRADLCAKQEFRDLLSERLSVCVQEHIIDEPVSSVEDLVSQIATTHIVVGTRFHTVLLALLCNKPVISISFHHKCDSLMRAMGLSEYCLDINDLRADKLIEKFCDLELNAGTLKPLIRERAREFREALDDQYRYIFNNMRVSSTGRNAVGRADQIDRQTDFAETRP